MDLERLRDALRNFANITRGVFSCSGEGRLDFLQGVIRSEETRLRPPEQFLDFLRLSEAGDFLEIFN